MFDHIGIGLIALILLAVGVAVYRFIRKSNESTPLSPVHAGKRHDHDGHTHDHEGGRFNCKFDPEEVRRTEGMVRPRIAPPSSAADPRVAAILAAIQQADIEKALKEISGEIPFNLKGKSVKLTGRNSYNGQLETAMQYLEQFYASIGIATKRHEYKIRGKVFYNLIVEFKGKKTPKNVLYVGGHLDSTAGWPWSNEDNCPGADDDGTGTVALMEFAKALLKMENDSTIRLVHFTCEEQGLYGSYAYSDVVSKIADETVIGMIEVDMIGYCAKGNRIDVHDDADANGSHSLVVLMTQVAAKYNLNLTVFDTHNHAVKDRSDHAGFIDHGYKAVLVSEEFTDAGFNPNYHTRGDRIGALNMPFMLDTIRMVMASICELAGCR